MKHFCTAGPIQPDIHYFIPPTERIDRDGFFSLVDARKYFILHAPRQTGKTTCLIALVRELNATGRYRALYANIEGAQADRENLAAGMRTILAAIAGSAKWSLEDTFLDGLFVEQLATSGPGQALHDCLRAWAAQSPMPIVLMIDEADALVGDTLISLLRQLRSGYPNRPERFPQNVVLCGVRDLRDYRIHGTKEIITGGSAFNIKAESLRLGDFTPAEVRRLYEQHTIETGQKFAEEVYPLVWDLTRGQPWLVNALAFDVCFRQQANRDRSRIITAEMIQEGKENLILRRDTHLDQLADKLSEERVKRVVQPILAGLERETSSTASDDVQYVIDLGLIRRTSNGLEIANAIYREVIPRQLNYEVQTDFGTFQRPEWYIGPDGRIEMDKLLIGFQQFFREHAEIWLRRFDYEEAGPQLLLQAFLQRIVNGGGRIDREYGLGRRRTDLLMIWKYPGGVQRSVIEIKLLRGTLVKTMADGLAQTADYMDRVGCDDGHLVIFDRSSKKPWSRKIYRRIKKHAGKRIVVWGL